MVVDPTDERGVRRAPPGSSLDDPTADAAMGRRARAYAEATFDIGTIADRFERILAGPTPAGAARTTAQPVRST